MSSLEVALQRALAVRLNLISLTQLPFVEEWMDIHLDRWLEHNPMPPDLPPDASEVTYLAMVGTELQRLWMGAWGDPRGFVPRMADYFKLCNIAKSDAAVLDQIGEHLEPTVVGSWIGVWGGKVTTGWHFWDQHPWAAVEGMFGTHEAKYQLKKFVEDHAIEHIDRFTQSIGDASYSEVELAMPGDTAAAQVAALSQGFAHFTGAPLEPALVERLLAVASPQVSLAVRIRGGKIARVGALAPGLSLAELEAMCTAAKLTLDPKLGKLVDASRGGIARVEYGRAGERAGIDVYLEPGDKAPGMPETPAPSAAN